MDLISLTTTSSTVTIHRLINPTNIIEVVYHPNGYRPPEESGTPALFLRLCGDVTSWHYGEEAAALWKLIQAAPDRIFS